MKSMSISNQKIGSLLGLVSPQSLASIAKNILFSRLEAIQVGRLTVEDNGECRTFGKVDVNEKVDEALTATIVIHNPEAYTRILFNSATGSGEAYMLGFWSSPNLVNVVRVIVANQSSLQNMDSGWSWLSKYVSRFGEFARANTKQGSRRNIAAHYDLSNEFFRLFLDETMMYSSAIFEEPTTSLEEAAVAKLDHICKRLRLNSDDHLLEIGTGWGGMAIYAARYYGCKVTTTTISNEQYELACERVKQENLGDRITVLKNDYRDLTGTYDKIVSIEMVEAVGHQFYRSFFSKCSHLLKSDGLMLMQAITTQDKRFHKEKNQTDFIRKYIFPGGCLPSNEVVAKHIAQDTDMHIVGLEDITLDYAQTLACWRERFFSRLKEVKALGFDDVFIRMWDFYLCYCEGGFRERVINTSQFMFAKPRCKKLPKVLN